MHTNHIEDVQHQVIPEMELPIRQQSTAVGELDVAAHVPDRARNGKRPPIRQVQGPVPESAFRSQGQNREEVRVGEYT